MNIGIQFLIILKCNLYQTEVLLYLVYNDKNNCQLKLAFFKVDICSLQMGWHGGTEA